MSDTRPSKLRLRYIIYICFLAIFRPSKLIEEENRDNNLRNNFSNQPNGAKLHRAHIINRAFWSSLGLIVLFGFIGGLSGLLLECKFGQPSRGLLLLFQVVGASLLLWGTLFIRGWEIQTFCGVTIVERINQWLYRVLYLIGTSIIICSLVWNY